MLYEIISGPYKKGATVITSNKSLASWGELIGDTALKVAIIDRKNIDLASKGFSGLGSIVDIVFPY